MFEQSAHLPILKKQRRWLFYSLAVGLGWVSVFIFEVALFNVKIRTFPTPFRVAAVAVPLVVLIALSLILLMGDKIIPWRYGPFGPYERASRPKGFHPRICLNVAPQRPQYATRYEIGEEGIEITFLFGSRAFLPASAITTIGPATWRMCVVEHDSAEIGSPLVVTQEVGEAILAGLVLPKKI